MRPILKVHLQALYRKICLVNIGSVVGGDHARTLAPFLFVGLFFFLSSAGPRQQAAIPASLKWSERMVKSIIKRSPEAYPNWGYTQGLVLYSVEKVWKETKNPQYLNYITDYADKMIDANGKIKNYDPTAFNIDNINTGKILFSLYDLQKEEKYRKTMEELREQLRWQPRTSEGGYWHKLRYPWQMWLDGAYMGAPFLAQYAKTFDDKEAFNDVAKQLILMETHMRDPKTGLLYHGWDESGLQDWSDPKTGLSPNFWGRAMGWYGMALVDVLDYFPQDHPDRAKLVNILQRLTTALQTYQDKKTGLWYQVVDQGTREGNYLEASASCMFVYTIAKGVRNGYLPKKSMKIAESGYQGIINNFIEVTDEGEINIHQVCEVAGLGNGRDGSFEYYVTEKMRSNDPKATAPFIMASLEMNK